MDDLRLLFDKFSLGKLLPKINSQTKECCFQGLIATGRTIYRGNNCITFLTIGVNYGHYVDLIIKGNYANHWSKHTTCGGFGHLQPPDQSVVPTCEVDIVYLK